MVYYQADDLRSNNDARHMCVGKYTRITIKVIRLFLRSCRTCDKRAFPFRYIYVPEVLVEYDHRYLDPGYSAFQEMLLDHDVHQETGDVEKRIDYVHARQDDVRSDLVQLYLFARIL